MKTYAMQDIADGDVRSTPPQTPYRVSVTDNGNPGRSGAHGIITRLPIGSICREQRMKNDGATHRNTCVATCRIQLILNHY